MNEEYEKQDETDHPKKKPRNSLGTALENEKYAVHVL